MFLEANLGPRSAQELFFFVFLEKVQNFLLKSGAHSERYRNLLAGIFEIRTFFGNIAFPLSPVLGSGCCVEMHYFRIRGYTTSVGFEPGNSFVCL